MTEKRYKAIPETGEYKDTVTGEFLSPKFEEGFYKVLDLLNENEELKQFKEDVFNEKHCNCWEEIVLPDNWSIVGKDAEDVELRLNNNNISCRVSFDDCGDFEYFIIKILDGDCHMCDISKALNIDVADVGIIESDKYYIVEIKNDEG